MKATRVGYKYIPKSGTKNLASATVRNDDIPEGKLGLSFHPEKSGLELESKNTSDFCMSFYCEAFLQNVLLDFNHELARMQRQSAGPTRNVVSFHCLFHLIYCI